MLRRHPDPLVRHTGFFFGERIDLEMLVEIVDELGADLVKHVPRKELEDVELARQATDRLSLWVPIELLGRVSGLVHLLDSRFRDADVFEDFLGEDLKGERGGVAIRGSNIVGIGEDVERLVCDGQGEGLARIFKVDF